MGSTLPVAQVAEPPLARPHDSMLLSGSLMQSSMLQPTLDLEDTWVTVFGFPPRASANVLEVFRAAGSIVQYEMSDGNWMHLRFAERLEAQRALGWHGRVFLGNLMLGVVPTRSTQLSVPAKADNAAAGTTRPRPPVSILTAPPKLTLQAGPVDAASARAAWWTKMIDYLLGW